LTAALTTQGPDLSIVVPVYNEEGSLDQLYAEIKQGCESIDHSFEIIFVDDGSTDGSGKKLDELAAEDARLRVVHFRRNFGKSPALAAAFERARGQIIVQMDADLQDDPTMIGEFVQKIEDGADLVSGWKQRRNDPITKTLPSMFFNGVVRMLSGIPLKDFNCGYKAYRIECVRELSIYGGFHRFLPVLAGAKGFRIEQVVVRHRAREHGTSKYGLKRFFDGLLDLLTVLLVTKFRTRPLHFFGIPGLVLGAAGIGILIYLSVLWFMGDGIGSRPLLTLGVLLTITAAQFVGIGLLAELLVRTTVRPDEIYSIREERLPPAPPPQIERDAAPPARTAARH
jgi:glycosyltransferase involved in cell wall biosynthesis